MLYFNLSPNSHLSVVSITFVPHLFMPQLWACYRLLTRADEFQGLIGFSTFISRMPSHHYRVENPRGLSCLGNRSGIVISQCLSSDLPSLAADGRLSHALNR